jgi:hypothetical protein
MSAFQNSHIFFNPEDMECCLVADIVAEFSIGFYRPYTKLKSKMGTNVGLNLSLVKK